MVHTYPFGEKDESQVNDCFSMEFSFLRFEEDIIGSRISQEICEVGFVFFQAVGIDEDLVEVGGAKHVAVLLEAIIDQVLECCWCVC